MPDPSAAIAAQQAVQKVLGFAGDGQHRQAHQAQAAAHKVHAAAGAVVVLTQIKRVELGKAGVPGYGCLCGVHGVSPGCLSD